eukprot:6182553-Pleurochrysis_carterae.AAC.1
MVLRVIRQVDRRHVVHGERGWLHAVDAQFREKRPEVYTASLVASDAATISASQEERVTVGCFFDAHDIAAWPYRKTYPEVECRVAQSESE